MSPVYPKISIVTPSFNQGDFIEETIVSVLSQGYPNLEYIIIDGGSTDNSIEIIKRYADGLHYWVSEKDNGHYDAVNKGFKKSTGEILTYLNADDILIAKSLFTIAEVFSKYENIQWLGGVSNHIDETGRCIFVSNHVSWNRFRFYKKDFMFIQQEGTFWRRSLWEKVGDYISTDYKLASDLELWSRFFSVAEYYVLPVIIAAFRVRSKNQKSLELFDQYMMEAEKILNAMPIPKKDKKIMDIYNRWYLKYLYRIPLIKKLKFVRYNYKQYHTYPAILEFDRIKQTF